MSEVTNTDNKISRRDFLKLATVGAATTSVILATEGCSPNQEQGRWGNDRFFEKPRAFDNDLEQEIRTGLNSFADEFGDSILEVNGDVGFDKDKWKEDVNNTLSIMRRMGNVYLQLEKEGILDNESMDLLQRDFYDSGSVLWAMLRVAEKFKDNKDGFKHILTSPDLTMENGLTDPLLGDEIFTIQASWADQTQAFDIVGRSRLADMIRNNNVFQYTKNDWWKDAKGPIALSEYRQDKTMVNRPEQVRVISENPEIAEKFRKYLEHAKLDRIANDLDVLPDDHVHGNYDSESDSGGSDKARDIEVFIKAGFTPEEIEKYDLLLQSVAVHEAGHALKEMTQFGTDDLKVFKNRVKIEKILNLFRPYSTFKRFFQPEGEFYKNLNVSGNVFTEDQFNERQRIINMTTVTEYASRQYTDIDIGGLLEVTDLTVLAGEMMADQNSGGGIDQMLVYRLIADLPGASEADANSVSFTDYWAGLKKDPMWQTELAKASKFELGVINIIDKNAELLNASERPDYVFKQDWKHYFTDDVLPIILTQMYSQNPKSFKKEFLNSLPLDAPKDAIEHSIDNAFLVALGKRRVTYSSILNGELSADDELFADIVAYNSLRKRSDVQNQISSEIWNQVDIALKSIIEDLVSDGLAKVPTSAVLS